MRRLKQISFHNGNDPIFLPQSLWRHLLMIHTLAIIDWALNLRAGRHQGIDLNPCTSILHSPFWSYVVVDLKVAVESRMWSPLYHFVPPLFGYVSCL